MEAPIAGEKKECMLFGLPPLALFVKMPALNELLLEGVFLIFGGGPLEALL